MNKRKIIKIIGICSLLICTLGIITFSALAQSENDDLGASTPKISDPLNIPKLGVRIPGLNLREATCDETACTTPWLADYIQGIYQYGLTTISILAVITLMIGGIIWITAAGNQEKVGEAKKWISGSLFGVLIAFTSYLILDFVNPALTELSPIKISYLENVPLGEIELDSKFPDQINDTSDCPSGVTGLNNLVTYFTTNVNFAYSQAQRGACSGGNCYCDCSWFAMHLGRCAGLKTRNSEGTSATLFQDPNKVKITQQDCQNSPLSPGDIIVWRGSGGGHVLTYIGNNKMIECGGGSFGSSILERSGALKITDWKQRCSNYLLSRNAYYIKR